MVDGKVSETTIDVTGLHEERVPLDRFRKYCN